MAIQKHALFDPPLILRAAREAFVKLSPRTMVRNPVMFIVLVGSVYTTVSLLRDIATGRPDWGFTFQLTIWLWFTVLFANFAEAMAEGRGKAQAEALRRARTETQAKRLENPERIESIELVSGTSLRAGDFVICVPGDVIPGDGEVVQGVASVDESAITGESAPVVRESGGDRSAVTGGTKVLSDHLVIRITANPGETFIDRMIALVEGASRQKTPNEICTHNFALGADDCVFAGGGDVAAVCDLRRWPCRDSRADCAPRLPNSDHDWWVVVRDRYRGNGSSHSTERDCDQRTSGGSGR